MQCDCHVVMCAAAAYQLEPALCAALVGEPAVEIDRLVSRPLAQLVAHAARLHHRAVHVVPVRRAVVGAAQVARREDGRAGVEEPQDPGVYGYIVNAIVHFALYSGYM